MRLFPPRIPATVLIGLCLVSGAVAQQTAPATSKGASATTAAREGVEQQVEKIRIEDKGSVIDELRVGGQTQSIEVKPKGGMPAYQVAPHNGQRSWKILGF